MIDTQSSLKQRQASLLGIPAHGKPVALAPTKPNLNATKIRQRLVDRGYRSRTLDNLIKNFVQHASTSGVGRLDAWVHVTHYLALAEIVFGSSDKAARWLQRTTVHIEGATEAPIMMLSTREGSWQVEERLQQIRYGMYV